MCKDGKVVRSGDGSLSGAVNNEGESTIVMARRSVWVQWRQSAICWKWYG